MSRFRGTAVEKLLAETERQPAWQVEDEDTFARASAAVAAAVAERRRSERLRQEAADLIEQARQKDAAAPEQPEARLARR